MFLDAERFPIRAACRMMLILAAILSVGSAVQAQDDASSYAQLCEEAWRYRPDIKVLCVENHRLATERYKHRRVREISRRAADPDLSACVQDELKTEEAGGVADWRKVEDCLLSRSTAWVHALLERQGTVAVEAARYSCSVKDPNDVEYFDICFYRKLLEGASRLPELGLVAAKKSSRKIYRLCLPAYMAVTSYREEEPLEFTLESLRLDIQRQFGEMPRSDWLVQDDGVQCKLEAGRSNSGALYWPTLELCYRWSTDAEFSRFLEPWPLWSHPLSLYVCENQDYQPNDTCLLEQFRATLPICKMFQSLDKEEFLKSVRLRASHICEAVARFDDFGHDDPLFRFDGFYDLPSFRYCMAEQMKLMGFFEPSEPP